MIGHQYINKASHFGQRKLLITEIMFLTLKAHPKKEYTIIYAGAASNSKYPVLYELFKMCRFILIDPNPFSKNVTMTEHIYFPPRTATELIINQIKTNPQLRTFVINDLCTIDLISALAKLPDNILFISDIRTKL